MTYRQRAEEIRRSATDYERRLRRALQRAHDLSEETLARLPVDAVAETIVNEVAAPLVVVDHSGFWMKSEQLSPLKGQEHEERRVRVAYNVTADGAISAMTNHAARAGLPLSTHTVGDQPSTVTFEFVGTNEQMAELEPERLAQSVADFHDRLKRATELANQEIEVHRTEVREQITAILESRARRIKAFEAATTALSIPVAPRSQDNVYLCGLAL